MVGEGGPGQPPPSYPQPPPGYGQPGYGQPGYGQPGGYFPPGYGAWPAGQEPPTYTAWIWIAAIVGVLFSLILGFPTAMIALSQARKVRPNWQTGNQQAAIKASRRARTWVIVSSILDVLGVALFALIIGSGPTTGSTANSSFSQPAVVMSLDSVGPGHATH
jgi:hypothetical protein